MTGFNSKRDAAADKLQGPVCDKDPHGCWNVRCQLGKQCKNLAQPAQVLGDQVKYGTSWSKDGERIDPMSVYKEQPAQEPVAWAVYDILHGGSKTLHWPEQHSPNGDPKQYKAVPLYITPPQREPLTDEQIEAIWREGPYSEGLLYEFNLFARAIEAVHGIKENT